MRHEKTVSESRFGRLWEPWEVDEIGRKFFPKIIPMAKFHSLIACGYVLSPYNNPLLKAKGRKKLVKLQYVTIYYGEMTFSPW